MDGEEQQVIVGPRADEPDAKNGSPGEVKWLPRLLGEQVRGHVGAGCGGKIQGVHQRQMNRGFRRDHLAETALFEVERGPQGFVPGDDLAQGVFQRQTVQSAVQPHRQGDIECRVAARNQLIQEPEPALGRRRGEHEDLFLRRRRRREGRRGDSGRPRRGTERHRHRQRLLRLRTEGWHDRGQRILAGMNIFVQLQDHIATRTHWLSEAEHTPDLRPCRYISG